MTPSKFPDTNQSPPTKSDTNTVSWHQTADDVVIPDKSVNRNKQGETHNQDDFCLSNLINCDPCFQNQQWIEVYYIKEFIRRLNKWIDEDMCFYEGNDELCQNETKEDLQHYISVLAGEKLRGEGK